MNILVTGAKGMVGTALVNNLKISKRIRIEPDRTFMLMKSMNMIYSRQKRNWMLIVSQLILYSIWQE